MKIKKPVFYRNITFFSLYLLFFIGVAVTVMFNTKKDTFLFINGAHHPFSDFFFSAFTLMGDGIFIIALALFMFVLKFKRLALGLLTSYLISGLIVQVIKRLINFPRPAGFLPDPSVIHTVYAASLNHHNSFPSGHTTSAFAAAVIISLYSGKSSVAVITIIIACLVGYSRVYLGQHFVEDVLAGSFVGVIAGTFCYWLQERLLAKSYEKHNWGK
ncbi:MAG: phosphatase PAP2 family protein [Ferruginibacter sp.]|nr:phosphatase PAP2 family protein [Chitinophagaceae bacterium]